MVGVVIDTEVESQPSLTPCSLRTALHSGGLSEVEARILPQPKLQYGSPACLDVGGQVWNVVCGNVE